jgi:hypothetical protein
MKFNEIRSGREEDIRAYLRDCPTVSGKTYGMLAQLVADLKHGFAALHRIVQQLEDPRR